MTPPDTAGQESAEDIAAGVIASQCVEHAGIITWTPISREQESKLLFEIRDAIEAERSASATRERDARAAGYREGIEAAAKVAADDWARYCASRYCDPTDPEELYDLGVKETGADLAAAIRALLPQGEPEAK